MRRSNKGAISGTLGDFNDFQGGRRPSQSMYLPRCVAILDNVRRSDIVGHAISPGANRAGDWKESRLHHNAR
jgi:hypothetical protein